MTKNNKQSKKPAQPKASKPKNQPKQNNSRATPYTTAGGNIGEGITGFFGMPGLGKGIGRFLGAGIGSIVGSGDYQMMGPKPGYNVLSGQMPKFSSTHATNIVCHREFLGDLSGQTGFFNNTYPLNPGLATSFPWLSTIAANYQQYRFHGLMFEFRSEITDFVTSGAPGIIVMTTNYNADQNAFTSRQEAENAEFAVSAKPTLSLAHLIECSPNETAQKLYNIRVAPVPTGQDLRLYDYGLTQIITQNNPSQVMGEVWVTYCVEFFKPILALENSLDTASGIHAYRTSAVTAAPLGTIQIIRTGTLPVSISGTVLTVTGAVPGGTYSIELAWVAATSATWVSYASVGVAALNLFANDTANFNISGSGTASLTVTLTFSATASTFTITPSVTLLGSSTVDLIVSTLDPLITN